MVVVVRLLLRVALICLVGGICRGMSCVRLSGIRRSSGSFSVSVGVLFLLIFFCNDTTFFLSLLTLEILTSAMSGCLTV